MKITILFMLVIIAPAGMLFSCTPNISETTSIIPAITSSSNEKSLTPLTNQEKEDIIKAALDDREIAAILRNESNYSTKIGWLVLTGFIGSSSIDLRLGTMPLNEDGTVEGTNLPYNELKNAIRVYPSVIIHIGNPEEIRFRIAIDRETKQILVVDKLEVGEFVSTIANPILEVKVETTIEGTYAYMEIAENGAFTYVFEEGLRMPMPGSEARRTTKTGWLDIDSFNNLTELFLDPIFNNNTVYEADTGMIGLEDSCVISFNYQGKNMTIEANFNPFRHDFMSFLDIQPIVKEICLRLKYIADIDKYDWQETHSLIAITTNS